MDLLLHNTKQFLVGTAVVLVTILLIVLDFKNKKLHNLQVQLIQQRYSNDKAAIDKGIKENDDVTKKLVSQADSAYEIYIRTHYKSVLKP